jgi:hypothetical protein
MDGGKNFTNLMSSIAIFAMNGKILSSVIESMLLPGEVEQEIFNEIIFFC